MDSVEAACAPGGSRARVPRRGRQGRLGCLVIGLLLVLAVPGVARATAASTIDAGTPLGDVACPSVSQCTAIDFAGGQVTFNPSSPGTPTPTEIASGYS